MEADTLEKLLKVTPRDQWEDPPEEKNPTTKGEIQWFEGFSFATVKV